MNKSRVSITALATNKEQIVVVYKRQGETRVSVLKPGDKDEIYTDSLKFTEAISNHAGDGVLVTYQIIVPNKSA